MCANCTNDKPTTNGAAPQPAGTEQLLAAILGELQSMKATQAGFEQKVSRLHDLSTYRADAKYLTTA